MQVERVPFLSATRFHNEYLDVRPVVMTAMTEKWPARASFTPERFRDELGDVPITLRRYAADSEDTFLTQTAHTTRQISMREWIDEAQRAPDAKAWSVRESQEVFYRVPEPARALRGAQDGDLVRPGASRAALPGDAGECAGWDV